MATVSGKTSEKIDELLGTGVVSGTVNSSGQLVLKTRAGVELSAGSVADPDAIISGSISPAGKLTLTTRSGTQLDGGTIAAPPLPINSWPVGSVFFNVTPTNPATLLGGGTWVPWAVGRMPVGVDTSQTEFDTTEETGGQKQHNHNGVDHTHGTQTFYGNTGGFSYPSGTMVASGTQKDVTTVGAMDGHTHSMTHNHGNTGGSDRALTSGNANQLSGTQGAGLPPYITCYIWKRTA